jgi:hypothetical protein
VTAQWDGTGKSGGENERQKLIRGRDGIVLDLLVVAALVVLAMIVHW